MTKNTIYSKHFNKLLVRYDLNKILIDNGLFRVLFGRDDDNLSPSVVSLMRQLDIDRRAFVSLMLVNTNFRTIRAIQEVLSSLI